MADIRFAHVAVNGVKLHVADAGPRDGRLVLLLHGFPEYWESWRSYIDRLAAAGYHVVVPDQRGYNLSDKPAGLRAYDIDTLAADIGGLADHFGQRRYTVIGHDWGGLVAWWIATRHPEQLDQLVIMNAPHPSVWREAMRDNPEQRRRSWYVRVFRLPWLPEYLLRRRHFRVLAESISRRARRGTVTPEELDRLPRRVVAARRADRHAQLVSRLSGQGFAHQCAMPDCHAGVIDLGRARSVRRATTRRRYARPVRQRASRLPQGRHPLGAARRTGALREALLGFLTRLNTTFSSISTRLK